MPTRDFTINTLATYLHLTPPQVSRLADRGKIPGRRVGGEWRFAREEIHHWLEHRIGLADEEELVDMEGMLLRSAPPEQQLTVSLGDMLPPEAVAIPLEARTRDSVLRAMVDLATATGLLWDPEKMLEAVRAREEMQPTALDNGVALLHPRRPMSGILGQAFLALGRTNTGIPFGSGRGGLTDLFFLIASVDDRGHLRTLARLSRVLGSPGLLERLRQSPDAAGARQAIIEAEGELPE